LERGALAAGEVARRMESAERNIGEVTGWERCGKKKAVVGRGDWIVLEISGMIIKKGGN
jgi:hypothetical protein